MAMVQLPVGVRGPTPRQGDAQGVGVAKWWIPLPDTVWDELRRPERYDEASWAAQRFMKFYGVPAVIFDQLVQEAIKKMGKKKKKQDPTNFPKIAKFWKF